MFTVCPASIEDMAEILALQKCAYLTEARIYNDLNIPPLLQTLEEIIAEARNGVVLKTIYDHAIIGSVRAYACEGTCYIGKLMVHPFFRRQGLAKKLLSDIEESFPEMRYELFTGHLSLNNLALYESLGYKRFKEMVISSELKLIYLEKTTEVRIQM